MKILLVDSEITHFFFSLFLRNMFNSYHITCQTENMTFNIRITTFSLTRSRLVNLQNKDFNG